MSDGSFHEKAPDDSFSTKLKEHHHQNQRGGFDYSHSAKIKDKALNAPELLKASVITVK